MSEARDYELLVRAVIEQLAQFNGVETLRLEHDVKVTGRSTTNQVDVLWEFRDADGLVMRIAIEARHLTKRVDQGRLHAFRSVIDDITVSDATTRGVMITTVGYQSGAKQVADTYGIGVLELRAPVDTDWSGLIRMLAIDIQVQIPSVTHLQIRADPGWTGTGTTVAGRTDEIRFGDKSLHTFLYGEFLAGHAAGIGERVEKRRIHVTFDSPRILSAPGTPDTPIVEIAADYEEIPIQAGDSTFDGTKNVAWVLLHSVGKSRAWGMRDGRIRITPSPMPGAK
jgi:hypothetical protein